MEQLSIMLAHTFCKLTFFIKKSKKQKVLPKEKFEAKESRKPKLPAALESEGEVEIQWSEQRASSLEVKELQNRLNLLKSLSALCRWTASFSDLESSVENRAIFLKAKQMQKQAFNSFHQAKIEVLQTFKNEISTIKEGVYLLEQEVQLLQKLPGYLKWLRKCVKLESQMIQLGRFVERESIVPFSNELQHLHDNIKTKLFDLLQKDLLAETQKLPSNEKIEALSKLWQGTIVAKSISSKTSSHAFKYRLHSLQKKIQSTLQIEKVSQFVDKQLQPSPLALRPSIISRQIIYSVNQSLESINARHPLSEGLQMQIEQLKAQLSSCSQKLKINEMTKPASLMTKPIEELCLAQNFLDVKTYHTYWDKSPVEHLVSIKSKIYTCRHHAYGAIVSTRGFRTYMEDVALFQTISLPLKDGSFVKIPLFGIFDGHQGAKCAQFLAAHLPKYLKKRLPNTLMQLPGTPRELAITALLEETFEILGNQYRRQYPMTNAGSAANIIIILEGHLWCANVGDSRAILSTNGVAIALSEDADLTHDRFKNEILQKKGQILYFPGDVPRINDLALARSVGERNNPVVSQSAIVTKLSLGELPPGQNFLILASDGLWGVASSNEVAASIYGWRQQGLSYQAIAANLVQKAVAVGSTDNITVLLFNIKHFHLSDEALQN